MKCPRRLRVSALAGLFLWALLGAVSTPVAQAFHFPWDQGHDAFKPDPDQEPTDPGPDGCNKTGSPFEVTTGNFLYSTRDLSVPALGQDLRITRSYHSRDMRSGPMGHGWTFNYDQRLIETTDGVQLFVICRQGNGHRERFLRNNDGSFTPPPQFFVTLEKNADGTFIVTERSGTQRSFDVDGRLRTVLDPNGNATTFNYDGTGFLIRVISANGSSLVLTKGPNGKIASIMDPAGRVYQYEYDADGNLTSFTDSLGNQTQYGYDSEHNLIKVVDPRGNIHQEITYDSTGRVSTYLEPATGEKWTVAYFPDQNKTTKRTSRFRTWTLFYNGNGNVTQRLNPRGGSRTYAYNERFLVSQVTDENGHTTGLEYDDRGNLVRVTDPLGNTTHLAYHSAFNKVTSVTDAKGNSTNVEYDASGNAIQITDALGHLYQMKYTPQGLLSAVTAAAGTPEESTTSFLYDAAGQVTTITDALNGSIHAQYDTAGNMTRRTDPEGRVTEFSYDPMNRLVSVLNADQKLTQYDYDPAGNLIQVTDAKNQTTTYAYDSRNRLLSTTNPLGLMESLTYDASGNITSKTQGDGNSLVYSYDSLNRLVRKRRPPPPGSFVSAYTFYTYDAAGKLVSVVDPDSTVQFSYDAANRISSTTASSPGRPSYTTNYSYDANGNRLTMTDPLGGVTTYEYDALNRLVSLTNPSAKTTVFTYDSRGRRASVTHGNGVTTSYTYDAASHLLSLIHQLGANTPINSFTYTYDAVGNRITRTDSAGSMGYTYDSINRLTESLDPAASDSLETFSYDPVGNRTDSNQNGLSVFNQSNQLEEDGEFTYIYDNKGNMVQKTRNASGQATRYVYDGENRLLRLTREDGKRVSYRYDGLGRRIEKQVDGVITRFIYDHEDILFETDTSNNVTTRYTHGPGIDEPLSMERNGKQFFFHTDGLGNVTELTGTLGIIVQSYLYDSFGKIISQLDPALIQPYAFTGREYDEETGLYFFRARNYDPISGRFLQEDPLDFVGGINFYVYVSNNPINYIDPYGLRYAEQYAVYGGVIGGSVALGGSIVIDAATGGLNLLATPAEIAGGTALGAAAGYGLGMLIDSIVQSQSGERVLDKIRNGEPVTPQDLEDLSKPPEDLVCEVRQPPENPRDPLKPGDPDPPEGRWQKIIFAIVQILRLIQRF